MDNTYDFGGYATRFNVVCSDGKVISHNAFKNQHGKKVPLVWNHFHDSVNDVLGYAILEHRDKDGVYAYCSFNDSENGKTGKHSISHGDIETLSIYANRLVKNGKQVLDGVIREVSLVVAGANPGAIIDDVMVHGDNQDGDHMIAHLGGCIEATPDVSITHSDTPDKEPDKKQEPGKEPEKEKEPQMSQTQKKSDPTVEDILNTMTEEQQTVAYAMVGAAYDEGMAEGQSSKEKELEMNHNAFEAQNNKVTEDILCHADGQTVLEISKRAGVNSFKNGLGIFMESKDSTLQHGFEEIEKLFPDAKELRPGAPEVIGYDDTWVNHVMMKVHKSPFARVKTRQADIRAIRNAGKGYVKGAEKTIMGDISLIDRTHTPQTVYCKDELHRDDIIDVTDFDIVSYQYSVMRRLLNEDLAMAFMLGDGREAGSPDKIKEANIQPIWTDDELYSIHVDIDLEAMEAKLQGSDTGKYFGEEFIFAESIIQAALYARENYKGSGNLDFYCEPRVLNKMLLSRDRDGRRIYNSKTDVISSLNVGNIYTAEQFTGKTRTTADSKTKKLLGIFVNMTDYNVGATRDGQVTKFEDFDIDFNTYKYLLETRLSGALTRIKSAIVIEEDVTPEPPAQG